MRTAPPTRVRGGRVQGPSTCGDPGPNLRFRPTMSFSKAPATLGAAGALALLVPTLALAQGSTPLEPVVVTASGFEQRITDALPHTTVLGEAEIRASGQTDLPGLLRGLAGFEVAQSGGHGAVSTVFLRGAARNQSLLLIDGVRVGSLTVGSAAIEQIPLDQIERVEIVRGNVSALYGANAVGGVIQVFTKQGRVGTQPYALVEVGSRSSRRVSAGVGGSLGEQGATRYSLGLSHFRTDGESALDPRKVTVNPDDDGYRNVGLNASLSHQLDARHRLAARLLLQDGRVQYDNAFAPVTRDNLLDTALRNLALDWDARFAPGWRAKLSLAAFEEQSRDVSRGTAPTRFDTEGHQIEWRHELDLGPGQAAVSIGTARQKVRSTTAYTTPRRDTDHLALAYQASLGRGQVQAALRHDAHSDVGGATTGLLAGGWQLDETFKLIGSVSNAFNVPTFNQLYFPGFSNPALKPEKARSVELGLQAAAGASLGRVALFRTRYRDLIAGFPATNIAHAEVEGLEFSGSTEWAGWRLRASATFQRPEDDQGETLIRRAREFGSVEIGRNTTQWRANAQLVHGGSRSDTDFSTFPSSRVTLPGHTLLNLTGAWKLAPALWLTGRVLNAADERYQTVLGYPSAGRELHVGLEWRP